MGGHTFARAYARGAPTLNTPRMSPVEYNHVKDVYLKKIHSYLENCKVAVMTEAPEKASYGDLDIFIACDQTIDFIDLANSLHVAGVMCHSSKKASLAVQKDGTVNLDPVPVYKPSLGDTQGRTNPSPIVTEKEYAQLDIEVVSPDLFEWHRFYSSYGDMAGMIGHICHPLGFTVNDRGLWLRLKELDFTKTVAYADAADRDGMVFLSSCPSRVIQFLGCRPDRYEAGFKSLEQLYEWLAKCEMVSPDALKIKRDKKAHERNREQTRSVYAGFFKDYLPEHMDMQGETDAAKSEEVVAELCDKWLKRAISEFSKREEYESKHAALVRIINNGYAGHLLKPLVTEHSGKTEKHVNEILRAFRRHVAFDAANRPYIAHTAHSDADSQLHNFLTDDHTALRDAEATSAWVQMNWEELRGLERQRGKDGGS